MVPALMAIAPALMATRGLTVLYSTPVPLFHLIQVCFFARVQRASGACVCVFFSAKCGCFLCAVYVVYVYVCVRVQLQVQCQCGSVLLCKLYVPMHKKGGRTYL